MAEETQVTETVETPEQPTEPAPEMGADQLKAELDKVQKALKEANAESASRRKKLEALEKAEQERKQAEMSEMEKLQTQLKAASEKAAKLEHENAQRAAAEKIGLPTTFASRIQGETPEEMEADAKTLLEAMPKPQPNPKLAPTNPGNVAGQGETDAERRRRLFG